MSRLNSPLIQVYVCRVQCNGKQKADMDAQLVVSCTYSAYVFNDPPPTHTRVRTPHHILLLPVLCLHARCEKSIVWILM